MHPPEPDGIAVEVGALVADLLPVLAPGASLDAAAGIVALPVGTARVRVTIGALVVSCRRLPSAAWPREVDGWLSSVGIQAVTAVTEREAFGQVEVEALLRVQVVATLPAERRAELVCAAFGDHLDIMVVVEHPTDGGPLTCDAAERLGLAEPGTPALRHTVEQVLPTLPVTDVPLPSGRLVRQVGRDGLPYATAALLDLRRFLPGPCPYGVLLGLPRLSRIALLPALSGRALAAATELDRIVSREHAAASDGCCDGIFWWVDDRLLPLPVDRTTGAPDVPPELRALAARLPRAGRDRLGAA